jgi:hypothetical protein
MSVVSLIQVCHVVITDSRRVKINGMTIQGIVFVVDFVKICNLIRVRVDRQHDSVTGILSYCQKGQWAVNVVVFYLK